MIKEDLTGAGPPPFNYKEGAKMKVRIFTDGACSENPGPGGWGVVFSLNDKFLKFSGNEMNTTNNRMELMAVVKAYERIKEKYKPEMKMEYELYSDSAYVVNSINNGWLKLWSKNGWKTSRGESIKNQDLWKEFIRLMKDLKDVPIKIIKIKGHHGITFNEFVDKIAKQEVCKAKLGVKNDVESKGGKLSGEE